MTDDLACRLYAAHDLRIEQIPEPEATADAAVVQVARGGICGSDLHYYHSGGFGPVRLQEPLVLGHEASAVVVSAPQGSGLVAGKLVALSPSRACGECGFCHAGQQRHCMNMRFNGSAMRIPHENGLFRTRMAHPVSQCLPVPEGVSAEAVAGAEPLAVCLHALSIAPPLKGLRVLVTGAGPIGAICTALARLHGAAQIIVTDVQDFTLNIAEKLGADRVVNIAHNPDGLAEYSAGKGQIDVVLECSANQHAIGQAVTVIRPQGSFMQIGVGGNTPVPLNLIVSKELRVFGTHRFDVEFPRAVRMIGAGEIDLSPIVTQVLPVRDAIRAFDLAGDRSGAVKVQLDFTG